MNLVYDILSLSLVVVAVLSALRFRSMDPSYHPFVYLVWVGVINEVLSIALKQHGYSTTLNNNVYVLLESFFLVRFFEQQGVFTDKKRMVRVLLLSLLTVWLVESFYLRTIRDISSGFRIFYSFLTVLISISAVNYLTVHENRSITRSALFWTCMGFILFFSFKTLVEIFFVYGTYLSEEFLVNVFSISIYLNVLVNFLYALAVLWIPRKREFSLL